MLVYFLVNFDIGQHHMAIAVTGRSGKNYGYATFKKEWGGHVLEMSAKAYEGDEKTKFPSGAAVARDINGGKRRSLSNWVVFAEQVADLESPEAKLTEEIDRLKVLLAETEAARDGYQQEYETLLKVVGQLPKVIPDQFPTTEAGTQKPKLPPDTAPVTGQITGPMPPFVEPGAHFKITTEKGGAPVELVAEPGDTSARALLDELGVRELRKLALQDPPLEGAKKFTQKEQFVTALLAANRLPELAAA